MSVSTVLCSDQKFLRVNLKEVLKFMICDKLHELIASLKDIFLYCLPNFLINQKISKALTQMIIK